MRAVLTVGVLLLVVLAGALFLFGQSLTTLPPEKQAIEDRYAAERVEGELHRAPKNPDTPYPIPAYDVAIPSGIRPDGDCDQPLTVSWLQFAAVNCWRDVRNCGDEGCQITAVTAGSGGATDPERGYVVVEELPPLPGSDPQRFFGPTPIGGPVRIVEAQARLLTLTSVDGRYVFLYDVDTGTFTSVTSTSVGPPSQNGPPCTTATRCLNLLRSRPLCGQGGSAKLQKIIGKKLRLAAARLRKAVSAKSGAKVAKLVAKTRAALQTIETKADKFVRRGSITADCRAMIRQDLALVTSALDAGRL
jgi:hypothetical protein